VDIVHGVYVGRYGWALLHGRDDVGGGLRRGANVAVQWLPAAEPKAGHEAESWSEFCEQFKRDVTVNSSLIEWVMFMQARCHVLIWL
jgi:hypothetical protein